MQRTYHFGLMLRKRPTLKASVLATKGASSSIAQSITVANSVFSNSKAFVASLDNGNTEFLRSGLILSNEKERTTGCNKQINLLLLATLSDLLKEGALEEFLLYQDQTSDNLLIFDSPVV